jgi:cyclophilin family peptidyl-prolyl cis-trans isomerase
MKKQFTLVFAALVLVSGCLGEGEKKVMEDSTTMKKTTYAIIETDKGTIKAKLYTGEAPVTTANFIGLAKRGFYDGLVFHRVEPGFVIQTGDPTGTGRGGSEKRIPLEVKAELKHELGALGMARTNDPNSATSQFYVVTGEAHFLDGNYAVFGQTVEGLEAAKKIKVGDKMKSVRIIEE